jgi:hypothetical protein
MGFMDRINPQGAHKNIAALPVEDVDASPSSTARGESPRSPRISGEGGGLNAGSSTFAPTVADLDREALTVLREIASERLAERSVERQEHEPCRLCGLGSSPLWRGPRRHSRGLICGRCAGWLDDPSVDERDLCAAILAGLSTPTQVRAPKGLGELVALQFFDETGRTEPNSTPWAHVDVVNLRRIVAELAGERFLKVPVRWNPARRVVW